MNTWDKSFIEGVRTRLGLNSLDRLKDLDLKKPKPEALLALVTPPNSKTASSASWYASLEPNQILGYLTWTSAAESLNAIEETDIRDAAEPIIPWLRTRPECLPAWEWLDSKLCELLDVRRSLNKESWTGIYFSVPNSHLELGPYRGFHTKHHVIPWSRGLCGQAVSQKKTVVSGDVSKEQNYLACSLLTKSEIVIPIVLPKSKVILGELDLDSPIVDAYNKEDQQRLEHWCFELGAEFESRFSSHQ